MATPTRLGALGATAALCLALAACSGASTASTATSSSTSSSTSSPSASASVDARHNAADVSFTQDMIVHHRGAVQMAQAATTRASSAQVKDLASRIEAAQGPEIEEMTGWLKAWGQPLSPTGSAAGSPTSSPMAGMDHSSGSMGMSGEMAQLEAATGTEFDRMFLQMMTDHHNGAIDMAKTEQSDGSNPQAIALAKSIEASQSAEIGEMAQMLRGLGS